MLLLMAIVENKEINIQKIKGGDGVGEILSHLLCAIL
jgi:hypothetical protein